MNGRTVGAALMACLLPAIALAQGSSSPERTEARENVRMACSADIQKYCGNIERAKGALRACLDQHQRDLSQECNSARAERAALRTKEKG